MSTTMKTPGVYIRELDAFGNSVVPVATAVPAFIGYTEKTSYNGKSLLNKAVKVTSLAEFLSIFGQNPPEVQYSVTSEMLPDRITVLEAEVEGTAKTLAEKQAIVDKAGDNATDQQKQAVTDAQAENDQANQNLTDAKANEKIKTLLDAQDAVDQAGDDVTQEQLDALSAANAEFQEIIDKSEFIDRGFAYDVVQTSINYRMYGALKFFYENGGGTCYVMSVGKYDFTMKAITDTGAFMDAITALEKEMEPTMLVIPDVVEVNDPTITDKTAGDYLQNKYANAYSLQNAMINHCGSMIDRVAILDIPGGFTEPMVGTTSVEQFRTSVSPENAKYNSYAAAYYPWLHTTVYQSSEISHKNIKKSSYEQIQQMLNNEFTDSKTGIVHQDMVEHIEAFATDATKIEPKKVEDANKVLQNLSGSYQLLMSAIMNNMNLMGPSSAMAGLYTSVDNNDGVWKAPANIGVQSTIMPAVPIDHAQQEDLNMPVNGKSVCAIRAFVGRGNLVWGARTLDGNSNDWRYINVRRTMIFLEQSVKEAAKAYVFAPNDATTWVNVKSMISNFLFGIWKQGGLVGPKPADAYVVTVGLGSTMTNDDILNGIMRVSVKVAVSHPAEFIEITFQQKMQEA
ncbi:MAG: phage tail sheath C-terminal domain-containing protein [Bacteroidota bacterium]